MIPKFKQSHHCYGPLTTSYRLNESTACEIAIVVVAAALTASIEFLYILESFYVDLDTQ
jgi:hypothetical protein